MESILSKLVHEFIEEGGVPVPKRATQIVNYLQAQGYSFESSRGILGHAVAAGFLHCICEDGEKVYD